MEKKKSKGKVVALIIAIVVVVGIVTTGIVLAATGALFGSTKEKAFDLLKQAPKKLVQSAVSEQLGMDELPKAMLDKGMDIRYKWKNMKGTDGTADLSGLEVEAGGSLDIKNKKAASKVAVSRNESQVSVEGYASLDEKKVAFSLPELIPNKTFSITASDSDSEVALNDISSALSVLPELQETFTSFLEEQGDVLYDSTECEKTDNGYQIKVTKASLDEFVNKFRDYVSAQSDTIGKIEEKLQVSKGTVASAVGMIVPQITSYTQDIVINLQVSDGDLAGISTSLTVAGVKLDINAVFVDNDAQSIANTKISFTRDGSSLAGITYSLQGKKGSVCEDTIKCVVSADGTEVVSCEIKETLDTKNNNALNMSASVKIPDDDEVKMSYSGSVKNLEKGKSITLDFNDISVDHGESDSFSFGMECSMAALDGELKMPAGEEQSMTPDTMESVLSSYQDTVRANLQSIVGKWNIPDISSMLFPSENDTDYSSDSYETDSYEEDNDSL